MGKAEKRKKERLKLCARGMESRINKHGKKAEHVSKTCEECSEKRRNLIK